MNNPNPTPSDHTPRCRECPAGVMRKRSVTYFTWLGEELVTVPNFPSWVCDVCGKREYDEQAVSMLNMLLSPEAGKAPRRLKRKPQPELTNRKYSQPGPADG